ncbi:hypothetical protein M514_04496, partial [Trichuris suis]
MAFYAHTAGVPFKCASEKKRTGVVSVSVEESIKTPISRLTVTQTRHDGIVKGIYVTYVEPGGPADLCGLKMHDKILQVNGYDFTLLTHERAVHYLKKNERLKMLVARAEVQEFP